MEFIELRDLYKTYHLGEIDVPVLKGISLTVSHGEFVALMGTSGSGKTTLMNILGCLDRPSSGEYWLEGQDVVALSADEWAQLRNQKIGFVFQTFNLLPRTSALENVIMPLSYTAEHLSDQEARHRAGDLLQRVGLGERLDHEPSQLSGGQQQRVAIARALINNPSILFADEPTGNLDSKTSEEVLELFRKLNEEARVTIILVTHDANVARSAKRIIRITDGMVEAEEPRIQKAQGEQVGASSPAGSEVVTKLRSGLAWLRLQWMVRTALHGLRRNVMRAALTTLGIVIGVAAVIAMMEIGRGSSSAIQATIASMGANNLLVLPGTASSGGVSFGGGSAMTLTPQDAEAILNESPAVRGAVPVVRARTQVIYGNRNWVPSFIYGTTPAWLDVREWGLAEGDMFTNRDVRNASKVCVLGQRLVRELFPGESPLGKEVRVKNVSFRVIGVLTAKGANMMGMDQDDVLLAPWTTIKFRVTGSSATTANQSAAGSGASTTVNSLNQIYPNAQNQLYPIPSATQAADTPQPVRFINVDQILAAGRSTQEIPAAIKQIIQILRERHRIGPGEPDDFNIRDMTEMTKALSSTGDMMTKLLLAVALISLLVGGVGIMNIMLVSVTERTREIGLRMAVGAWSRDILQQFLAESVILCFCGGVVGILVGRGISMLVRIFLRWPTELSLSAIVAAFAVSVTVGMVFGFYPAWKASRLDPIIALRYE
ncbi:MAG: macrolide ABC transporter ATP-binding protein [Deltaproteobacteria bacterium CG07_land_8_20_14_0_80_60_11]|nr:MAG: macrolide ABC transporter ATP-binding protein [Deltaproteobacteria bacterium CG07_land_8_20_14_0_80_60_11]